MLCRVNDVIDRVSQNKLLADLVGKLFGYQVTILTIHRASTNLHEHRGVTPAFLRQGLSMMKDQGFQFIALDELISSAFEKKRLSAPTVCFTLDDGYVDQCEDLLPVLLEFGAKPTVFVVSDFVDGNSWPWDAKVAYLTQATSVESVEINWRGSSQFFSLLSAEERRLLRHFLLEIGRRLPAAEVEAFLAYLTNVFALSLPVRSPAAYSVSDWERLRYWESQGVCIGAHSARHYLLSQLNDTEVIEDILSVRDRLKQELVRPSQTFCYPSGCIGDFSGRDIDCLKAAGFKAAVTSFSSPTSIKNIAERPFLITRVAMPENLKTLFRYVSWFEWLRSKIGIKLQRNKHLNS